MPWTPDEDEIQPRQTRPAPPPTPGQARPAQPPPRSAGFPWGLVGHNEYQALAQGRGVGIRRIAVGAGIEFHRPPLPPGSPAWIPDGDGYEMPLDGPAPGPGVTPADLGVTSLVEFRKALQDAADAGTKGEAFLRRGRELDRFADALLGLVEHLHDNGGGLGLIRPPSVLLRNGQVILPDLGFVRSAKAGPVWYPSWLTDENPQVLEWRMLWDEGRLLDLQAPDPAHDLRTIARLLSWLLTGQVRRTIPSRDDDPTTHAAVWGVLDDAVTGRISSAREFRDRLRPEECRPSAHFLPEKRKATADVGWAKALLVGLLLVAAAAGGGYWASIYLAGQGNDAPVDPNGPLPPLPPGRVADALQDLDNATTPEETIKAVQAAHDAKPSPDPSIRQAELRHKAEARRKALDLERGRIEQWLLTEQNEAYRLPECFAGMQAVEQRLTTLVSLETIDAQKKEMEECQRICRDWIARHRAVFGG